MNYEEITDRLIQETMKEFNMKKIYQEFLDSLIKFDDFKRFEFETFREYLDNKEKTVKIE